MDYVAKTFWKALTILLFIVWGLSLCLGWSWTDGDNLETIRKRDKDTKQYG